MPHSKAKALPILFLLIGFGCKPMSHPENVRPDGSLSAVVQANAIPGSLSSTWSDAGSLTNVPDGQVFEYY